jgi:hypothetical protein
MTSLSLIARWGIFDGYDCVVDDGEYKNGIDVTDEEFKAIKIKPHKFHGEWNYTAGTLGEIKNEIYEEYAASVRRGRNISVKIIQSAFGAIDKRI